jgi:tRNA nucleotidyltransferase (CCA-adding enzyme)
MKLKYLAEQITNRKKDLDQLLDKNLLRLNNLYKKNGYELRIVGGAVRDILMNKTPKDIDLASDATPEESLDILKQNNIRVIETGLQHGTITAHMDGEDYEITTLRIDRETDGRHAKVEYTRDWEKDAERRDLTFNAMSMDFDGNLYDYHGGHEDLKSGTARFVGDTDKRIQEDFLRILRYFRFQGRTDSPHFDEDTLAKIKSNASGLDRISGERIWMEVNKILSGNHTKAILEKMKETNVMDAIGLPNPNVKEFNKVKNNTNDPLLLMASLINSGEELNSLRDHWKFSNIEYNMMSFIIKHRNKNLTFQDAKRFHIMNRIDKEHLVGLLRYQGSDDLADKIEKWNPPEFPVNGNDLKSLGISPGPELGKALNDLKSKWVESGYTLTKQDLLNTL